jgi:hypothetical protein
MQRVVVVAARGPVYRKLVVAAAMVAAGIALQRAEVAALGWTLAGLGGIWVLLLLRSLAEERERLVIDDAGIRDTLLPVGTIGWSEVTGATVQQIAGVPVVELGLRDPELFVRRLPATRQFIARKALEAGLPAVYLTLTGTEADAERIADAIRQRIGAAGSRSLGPGS